MMTFGLLALGMAALAVTFVALPLLSNRAIDGPVSEPITIALYRARLAELQAERDAGMLAAEPFERARVELQRDLLESTGLPEAPSANYRRHPRLALALAVFLPAIAGGLYLSLGAPRFIAWDSAHRSQEANRLHDLSDAITRLRGRLAENPDDLAGWLLLGRSLTVQQQYDAAAGAYASALGRGGERADLLALYAEALAMAQGHVVGRPESLVSRALQLDPKNALALWLSGSAAFERRDYAAATDRWEALASLLPPESPMAKMVQTGMADARQRLAPSKAVPGGEARN